VGERGAAGSVSGKAEMGRGRIRGWAVSVPPACFPFYLSFDFSFFLFSGLFHIFCKLEPNQFKSRHGVFKYSKQCFETVSHKFLD
jgi:hypothetical protein